MELNNSNAASAFFTFLLFYLFTFNHAPHADGDEGNGQELSHVEKHVLLEAHLHVLRKLYEEAEGEDQGQAETEEKACAHALSMAAVEVPAYEEEHKIGYRLVELSRMSRLGAHGAGLKEIESPRHGGDTS